MRKGRRFELTNAHLLDYNNFSGAFSNALGEMSELDPTAGGGNEDVVNIPPIANAGSNYTITWPTNSVTLNGSLSNDPDGKIASYKWKQLNGPNTSSIEDSTKAITTATNLIAGTYTFQLTVGDDKSASATAQVVITVNPAQQSNSLPIPTTVLPATLGGGNTVSVTPAGTLVSTPTGNVIVPNPGGGTVISGGGGYGGGGFGSSGAPAEPSPSDTQATPTAEKKILGMKPKTAAIAGISLLALLALWKGKDIVKAIKGA